MLTFITSYVVSFVLNCITRKRDQKDQKNDIDHFIIRAPKDLAYLGIICAGAMLAIEIGIAIEDYKETGSIIADGWASYVLLIGLAILIIIGLLMMFAPIPGFWDIIVNNDEVEVIKLWLFKNHYNVKAIRYYTISKAHGGYDVFIEGRRRKAFFVDGMCNGVKTFEKRMAIENIPQITR